MRTPEMIQVHEFSESGHAYDMSQCRDDIEMGDVLVIKSEKVVGFLYSAWPVAVTKDHGKLHGFANKTPKLVDDDDRKRDWRPFHDKAIEVAKALGYELYNA